MTLSVQRLWLPWLTSQGAGLGGYKVARRTGDVEEFVFEPIGKAVTAERGVGAGGGETLQGATATEYVMTSLTVVSRQLSCRKVGESRVEAMRAWEARDMVDAHLLCEVDASGSCTEVEKYVTLDSALAQLREETKRAVSWERQKRERAPAGGRLLQHGPHGPGWQLRGKNYNVESFCMNTVRRTISVQLLGRGP